MTGVGLAIPAHFVDDHHVTAIVRALADPLIENGYKLYVRAVEDEADEQAIYRHWAESDEIVGAAVLGATRADPRVAMLTDLGLPVAAVAESDDLTGCAAVVVTVQAEMDLLRTFLEGRGHRRAVCIAASDDPLDQARADAIEAGRAGGRLSLVRVRSGLQSTIEAALDAADAGPVTLILDSDIRAAAVLAEFLARGIAVPQEAAIMSWTDSTMCRSASPAITAVDRRGSEIGRMLGRRMLGVVERGDLTHDPAPPPLIVLREST